MSDGKRFELPTVDCNTCQQYYQSTCDGARLDNDRKCRNYIATRQIDVESTLKEINSVLHDTDIRLNWILVVALVNLLLLTLHIGGII